MKHDNYRYHIEMMLNELNEEAAKPRKDTRIYLSLDVGEIEIIRHLLTQEMAHRDWAMNLKGDIRQDR